MAKFTEEDDALLDELGVEVEAKKKPTLTAKNERIIAGFEEIQRFVEENNRVPSYGEDKDIFERIYATRLDQIRRQKDCVELLKELDHQDLLNEKFTQDIDPVEESDDDALLDELGLSTNQSKNDITKLKHVKPRSEISPAEEIGQRTACKDFKIFKPLFDAVQADIKSGKRKVIPYQDVSVKKGDLFILSGQKIYVAEIGKSFPAPNGATDARLRVIFDNGVESNQKMRSLKRRLNDDKASRRITDLSMGPLFDDQPREDDEASGIIYVCRSKSNHPLIEENRNLIHKIGVTNKSIESRLSDTEDDPTFLLAKVDLVASFELYNINRNKLETLLHKIFASARLDIEIPDRFGKPYRPKEWFCVTLEVIQDAVKKIKEGTITDYRFNIKTGSLEKHSRS